MALFERRAAPSFDGATGWLNTEPLESTQLRGEVVLVNFWTLTCINWLRQEPYVRAWARAYRDDGLVVVGVHTPEFSFEHDTGRIAKAIERFDIDYPVAIDNDYGVWQAFDNHYWPALYFLDRDGRIRDEHFGEGRYEESERLLQKLLGVDRPPLDVRGTGIEAEADWETLRTPETYLGYARGQRFASTGEADFDRPATFAPSAQLGPSQWTLAGEWSIGAENVTSQGDGAGILFRFHSRDVHLVMSPGEGGPIPFRVTLDGSAPGDAHGGDVDAAGDGVLDEGRLWQLLRVQDPVRDRVVEVTFGGPGAECYSFTFG